MPVSPPYHHYAQYPPPLPTSRSFQRPPPESVLLIDPTRFLVALPVCVLALGLAYRLDCLPLELHLLARLVHVKMGLLGSLFGFGRKAGAGKAGEGEPEWALEDRRQRANDVERYASLLPRETPQVKGYHPGIVNMSGTFCFLNSILQVLASSPRFLEYSYSILASSSTLPGPPPQSNVTSTLLPFLLTLVTPSPSPYPRPLRPTALVEALRLSDTFAKAGMFGRLREQQDAHELWALLSDAVEEEDKLVRNLTRSQRAGLRTFLAAGGEERGGEGEPWMGRMAYRRACRICGYSEGIRLMQSGEVSLSLPERTSITTLERLLEQVSALEMLTDSQCRKCRIVKTHAGLKAGLLAAALPALPPSHGKTDSGSSFAALIGMDKEDGREEGVVVSASKKKRLRAERRELEREKERLGEVEKLMVEQRWEDDVEGVQWKLVDGGVSTRQEMFSTPPPLLVIHLNRSSFTSYATKNACQVVFPPVLDLSPFCTTGKLQMDPSRSMSEGQQAGTLDALKEGGAMERVGYRLVGFVNHLGGHSSGHYITYRLLPHTNRWLRISDDDVLELPEGGGEEVWKWSGRGEVVLLFYERLVGTRLTDGRGEGAGGVFRAGSATPSGTGGSEAQEQDKEGGSLPSSTFTPSERPPSTSPQDSPSPPTPPTPDAVVQNPPKEETAVEDESALGGVEASAPAGGEDGSGQKKRKKKTRKK